ncbi:MAG: hypothetical protein ACI8WA_000980, partial [Polaribacter sp.]
HLIFKNNSSVIRYKNSVFKLLNTPKKSQNRNRFLELCIITNIRIKLLTKALYSKSHFMYVINKLSDIKWYQRVLSIGKTNSLAP